MESERVTIIHCDEDESLASRLVRDLDERGGIHAQLVGVSRSNASVLLTRSVYWLPLITEKAFRSLSTVVVICKLLDELSLTAEKHRMLPLLIGGDDELRQLRAVLPTVARRTPLMIRNEEGLCKLPAILKAKLGERTPDPAMEFISLFDKCLWLNSLWLDETKEVIVPVKERALGIGVKLVEDAAYIAHSVHPSLLPGDRLVEVEGYGIDRSSISKTLIKLKAEKSTLRFKVRSHKAGMADFLQSLPSCKEQQQSEPIPNYDERSAQESSASSEKVIVLLICTAKDAAVTKQFEKHIVSCCNVSCRRIVTSDQDEYPDPGTVDFQYLLPVITSSLLESRKASGTVSFFLKKMKEWRNHILPFLFGVKAEDVVKEFCTLSGTKLFQFDINSWSAEEFPTLSSLYKHIVGMSCEFMSGEENSLEPQEAPIVLKRERRPFEESKTSESEEVSENEAFSTSESEEVSENEAFSTLKHPEDVKVIGLLKIGSLKGISYENYKALYDFSLEHSDKFWGQLAEQFDFRSADDDSVPAQVHKNVISKSFDVQSDGRSAAVDFLPGLKTNLCANLLDLHITGRNGKKDRSNQPAVKFVSVSEEKPFVLTYRQLFHATCKYAKFLDSKGLVSGNRAFICMKESPARIVAILACLRLGITVGLGSMTSDRDQELILKTYKNSGCQWMIEMEDKETIAVIEDWEPGKTACHSFSMQGLYESDDEIDPKWLDTSHTAFFATTTGTTGDPKVVEHQAGGYMVFAATTLRYLLDFNVEETKPSDVCLTTADLSWIYGWTVGLCAPLLNGGTIVRIDDVHEALNSNRIWSIVAACRVTHFCSTPRVLGKVSGVDVAKMARLKVISSSGDRLYDDTVKELTDHLNRFRKDCNLNINLFDVWWQTETGAFMMGSSSKIIGVNEHPKRLLPFYGVRADIRKIKPKKNGADKVLVISQPWPGCFRGYYKGDELNKEAFRDGVYVTGDNCDVHLGQYDDARSPRVYEVVGRTENVFNFVAVQRRYLVAAEDIEELCRIFTITAAHAKTEKNKLLIEVEEIEGGQENRTKLENILRKRIPEELRNLVDEDRELLNEVTKFHFVESLKRRRDKVIRGEIKFNRFGIEAG